MVKAFLIGIILFLVLLPTTVVYLAHRDNLESELMWAIAEVVSPDASAEARQKTSELEEQRKALCDLQERVAQAQPGPERRQGRRQLEAIKAEYLKSAPPGAPAFDELC